MNAFALPDSLVDQLRAYEQRLKRMETLAAIAGGLAGLLATYVVLFVSDRFVDTPRWARIVLTLAGGGFAAWWAHAWARHWLWDRRGPTELARLLQRHFKSLGDRLQGIIELTETEELPPNLSPALLRAAIRQVADESKRFDFTRAVPVRPTRRWGLAATTFAILAAAPFVFVPAAAKNALLRWITPWSAVERYTFTSLDALPAEMIVPHGEAFEISCGLADASVWKPAFATAQLDRYEPQRAQLESGHAIFHITGQTQKGTLTIRAGDASRSVSIVPMHRPELKDLTAKVKLPTYLGYPQASFPIQSGSVDFLAGSSVQFEGKISRALKFARMRTVEGEPAAELKGDTFLTPLQISSKMGADATFRWEDTYGLTPTQPYSLHVGIAKDEAPRVDMQGLEQDTAMLATEVLKIKLSASDDYGLKDAWFGWSARPANDKKAKPTEGKMGRIAGEHTKKELASEVEFAPILERIPNDSVVEFAAYANDYLPGRKPVESWKYTIYVLSPAKHADRVRERMDEILKELDERIRDEERQLEETKAIADDKSHRTEEDIKRLQASERANAAMLEKMMEEMKDVLKDALRNSEVPEKTVAELQKLTEMLKNEAQPPMQSAAQSLQQAASEPQEKSGELAKAQEQQQKALDAMRKASQKMGKANENLYAHNFYNRLRAAADAENQVADSLKELAKSTIGRKPQDIPEEQKKQFAEVAKKQDDNTKNVDGITNDLTAFTKRVPMEKYENVEKDMREKRAGAELSILSGLVRANLGLKSVGRARQWSGQLNDWAAQLQDESQGGGSGGGGGEMDPELMQFIIAMVRVAQAQGDIRDQTQVVDAMPPKDPQRALDAVKLSDQEDDLRDAEKLLLDKSAFTGLKPFLGLKPGSPLVGGGKSKFADFKPALEAANRFMGEVTDDLRKPKTDAEVVGTQSTIIELLVPPGKKNDGSQSQAQSQAQAMMQQMMMQISRAKAAGGNNGKSNSPFSGEATEGSAALGDAKNQRHVEKAGGAADAGEWPEEFRDQLQSYFQQLESGGK